MRNKKDAYSGRKNQEWAQSCEERAMCYMYFMFQVQEEEYWSHMEPKRKGPHKSPKKELKIQPKRDENQA